MTDGPVERHGRLARPPRWQRNAAFGIVGATIVLGWVGDATWASLVDRHPLWLILLNAKPRYLVLTVNHVDAWVFYPVATLRLLATKPLVWLIGAWYGNRAVAWAARRSERGAEVIRWLEQQFPRFGWLIVLVTSNNVVCLLAGASGFPLLWFLGLAVVGTLARLWIIDHVGARFSEPIDQLVGFVGDHRVPVVAASVVVVVGGLWWQHRAGRSLLDDLVELERATDAASGPRPADEDPADHRDGPEGGV